MGRHPRAPRLTREAIVRHGTRRQRAVWCAARAMACVLALAVATTAARGAAVSDTVWVDHDGRPIPRPPMSKTKEWGDRFHQIVVEPLSHAFDVPDKLLAASKRFGAHPQREAVNVNAFDEAPNSSWFTNRNHVRAVPVSELVNGPDSLAQPSRPWTIKHAKREGMSAGFQIKDAEGRKWLVKTDPRGYPQLNSGADMVARTLIHAAGYNVPHNVPVRFLASDLEIDKDLAAGKDGERFTAADLESLLAHAATCEPAGSAPPLIAMRARGTRASQANGVASDDVCYLGMASLFVSGKVLGAPSMRERRPGDTNDWYTPTNRRELRGLYVLCSWIGDWDTKDQNFLDTFVEERDSLGHVVHYLLDVGGSLGASALGPKPPSLGYEKTLDFGWMGRRLVTLGFVQEPWRRAHQDTGIPSVGNFEADVYRPSRFTPQQEQPAFRAMTDRDGYWGAKIVASFSDAQIAAAVDAAAYDDPGARAALVSRLIQRRDKIARHWFGRVAPLDFFSVEDGVLRFHDLAVDTGLEPARGYNVQVDTDGTRPVRFHIGQPELPLVGLGNAGRVTLLLAVAGRDAAPARVELTRRNSRWIVTGVRHG